MTASFMTETEFLEEINGIPHMFHLNFSKLEDHLLEKFGYLEDWEIEIDGEHNGTVRSNIVEYVRKTTLGAITDIEISCSKEKSYDGSYSERSFVVYTTVDRQFTCEEVVDCLFLADKHGALNPLFFPDWYGLEERAGHHNPDPPILDYCNHEDQYFDSDNECVRCSFCNEVIDRLWEKEDGGQ